MLKQLFGYFRSQPPTPARAMSSWDQETILKYATGDESLKKAAIAAYRRTPKLQHGDPGIFHYLFMREVDTAAPDLGWRATQRERLLKSLER